MTMMTTPGWVTWSGLPPVPAPPTPPTPTSTSTSPLPGRQTPPPPARWQSQQKANKYLSGRLRRCALTVPHLLQTCRYLDTPRTHRCSYARHTCSCICVQHPSNPSHPIHPSIYRKKQKINCKISSIWTLSRSLLFVSGAKFKILCSALLVFPPFYFPKQKL